MINNYKNTTGMAPLQGDNTIKYKRSGKNGNKEKNIMFSGLTKALASNGIFARDNMPIYDRFNRYGYKDPYHIDSVITEYLFFTKPDLNLFNSSSYSSDLNPDLKNIPYFEEVSNRNRRAITQLQYSVKDRNNRYHPFMYLLSNTVNSKLDLPGISADSQESTSNIMGTSIQYRSHSYKSDNGYDFSLSFTDTAYLDVYYMAKTYDEYMRLLKLGEVSPIRKYIDARCISEQFSIYKFLIGSDGETILYYAKLTGVYFTDVPRGDFGDPSPDGFKFSLSFHAQFVEDNNPLILREFNRITPTYSKNEAPIYDAKLDAVDNRWVKLPKIVKAQKETDLRVSRNGTNYDYRMKWFF